MALMNDKGETMDETPITWTLSIERESSEIPERATITVKIPGGEIDIRLRDGGLHLTGCQTLVIEPRASNAIRVRLELPDWN